jgi:phenylpropionate dioxygenase-like ring-hydroxylating dioxygenase large terminal subunit
VPVLVDQPALLFHWYALALSSELGAGPLSRTLLGQPLVLWRAPDGQVIAAPDRCPHREAPLSAGTVTDGVLTCPYHGWQFGTEGRCVRIPSSVEGVPIPPAAKVTPHHAIERYGLVWVCLGEPESGIPDIANDLDPAFRRINNPVEVWNTSVTRMTDNFLDITHFPFVHTGTFGRAQSTVVPRFELEPLDSGWFGYRYEIEVNNPSTSNATTGVSAKVLHREMTSGFVLPFAVRSTILYETGLEHVLLLLSTPIDDVTSYFTFVVWRNDDFSVSAEEVIAFDRAIGAEDKAMLEKLNGVLPLSQTGTVSVQADKASVEWRRQLAAMLGVR